jgi:glycosyltransferase involved in cell wall biosynthesis
VKPLLFVSGEYPPDIGGLGDYTDRLRGALHDGGWPSSVLTRRHVRRWDARSLVRLARSAPGEGIVHIQFQAGAFDLLGDVCVMPALLRRIRPAVRVVTTFHDTRVPYLFPRAGPLRQAAVGLLARTSHAVIAADQRDLALLGGPSPRHHHVPIGPNVSRAPPAGYEREAFRAQRGLAALVVVYFGLLNASKGLDMLLSAFELILRRFPGATLLLLGGTIGASDPTDRMTAAGLQERLSRLGDRLVQPGWLPERELSAYLLAADVALLPYVDGASARRGSLLACAEHGLPIVSTEPAAPEVADGVHAVAGNPRALADAVLQIADAADLADRLRQQTRLLVAHRRWPRIAEAHISVYQSLLYS